MAPWLRVCTSSAFADTFIRSLESKQNYSSFQLATFDPAWFTFGKKYLTWSSQGGVDGGSSFEIGHAPCCKWEVSFVDPTKLNPATRLRNHWLKFVGYSFYPL